jgi:hypothetical protein
MEGDAVDPAGSPADCAWCHAPARVGKEYLLARAAAQGAGIAVDGYHARRMRERGWLTVIAVAGATAAWMNVGTLHSFHHADSLIPVLVSTQRWTPFFWGQDRFGMLVPLLASPIRHPLANLVTRFWR